MLQKEVDAIKSKVNRTIEKNVKLVNNNSNKGYLNCKINNY